MAKVRTTLTMDEAVVRAVRARAARSGKSESAVIEEALRHELGLDLLDRLWDGAALDERQADALARDAQHATRRARC